MSDKKTNSQKAIDNLTRKGYIYDNTLQWMADKNPVFAEKLTGKLDEGGSLNIQYNVPIKTSSTYTDEFNNQYPVYELYLKEFIPASSPGYHISNISKYIKDETKELKILNFNYFFKAVNEITKLAYYDAIFGSYSGAPMFMPIFNSTNNLSLPLSESAEHVTLNSGDILWLGGGFGPGGPGSGGGNVTVYSKILYTVVDKSTFDDLNYDNQILSKYNILNLNSIIKDSSITETDTFNLWYSKEGSDDKVLTTATFIPEYNGIIGTIKLPELSTTYNAGFVINNNIYSNSISVTTTDTNPFVIDTSTDDGKLAGAIQSLFENQLIATPYGITQEEMDENYIYYNKEYDYPLPAFGRSEQNGFNKKAWEDGYGDGSTSDHLYPQNCIVYDTNNKVWRNMRASGTTPYLKIEGEYVAVDDNAWPSSFNKTPYLSVSLANNDDSNPTSSYSTMLQLVDDDFYDVKTGNISIYNQENKQISVINTYMYPADTNPTHLGVWYSEDNGKTKVEIIDNDKKGNMIVTLPKYNVDYLVGGFINDYYNKGQIINIKGPLIDNLNKTIDESGFIKITADANYFNNIDLDNASVAVAYIKPTVQSRRGVDLTPAPSPAPSIPEYILLDGDLIKSTNSSINPTTGAGTIECVFDVPQADQNYQMVIGLKVANIYNLNDYKLYMSNEEINCLIESTNPTQSSFVLRSTDNDTLQCAIPQLYNAGLIASPAGITNNEYKKNYMIYIDTTKFGGFGYKKSYGINNNALLDYGDNNPEKINNIIAFNNKTKTWSNIYAVATWPGFSNQGNVTYPILDMNNISTLDPITLTAAPDGNKHEIKIEFNDNLLQNYSLIYDFTKNYIGVTSPTDIDLVLSNKNNKNMSNIVTEAQITVVDSTGNEHIIPCMINSNNRDIYIQGNNRNMGYIKNIIIKCNTNNEYAPITICNINNISDNGVALGQNYINPTLSISLSAGMYDSDANNIIHNNPTPSFEKMLTYISTN